jgi:hypothetical protein
MANFDQIIAWFADGFYEAPVLFPLEILLWVFVATLVWKYVIVFNARFLFAWRQSKKSLVYMRVQMPRQESKKDREQTEKDFRERIAIMEQLFRAVNEIQELNLWNKVRSYIWNSEFVSFELIYRDSLLYFYIVTNERHAELLEKQVTSYYSDAEIIYEEKDPIDIAPKGKFLKGYFMYLKRISYFPIRTYKTIENDPLNDITNVFSKLKKDDRAAIQIVVDPLGSQWNDEARQMAERLFRNEKVGIYYKYIRNIPGFGFIGSVLGFVFGLFVKGDVSGTFAPGAGGGDKYVRMLASTEEVLKKTGEKADKLGFNTTIRLMASSDSPHATQRLLDNLVVSFNIFAHQGSNWFQNRRIIPIDAINNFMMLFNFKHRLKSYGEKNSILVEEELASVYHIPTSRYNYTPIIAWLSYKVLPPPTNLPKEGILMGHNVYRGKKQDVFIMPKDRTRHMYIVGKSGSGKSVLLNYMARQDIQLGNGGCVIDPHGDLIEDCLGYIPKERAKDVIHFSPADQERPMGLNMLQANTPEQMDMASSQATEIFIKLFGDEIFGPRIQHYFRNACLTLMEDKEDGATLIDVPRMFVDEEFMKYKVTKITNPVVRSFWEHEYANTGDREKQEMIPYFSSKFGPFITNTIMRNTIGQPKSAFDFRSAMDEGKILLVNLSKGKVGDLNTQLLGLVCVAKLQQSAMSRVDMPEKDRRPFYMYVDEFQNFATESFCSILSEARKYKLALIMAHQYIGQLTVTKSGTTSTQIRDAVFGNVGTILSFKVGADDGEYLEKEYAPVLSANDVVGIANYKAYCKLLIDNSPSRPFSIETIYDTSGYKQKTADIVKEYCRLKYGRKRAFVDQEIETRIGIT